MTLNQALAKVLAFMKDPPPILPTVTTGTVVTTPGTYCFDEGVSFQPLDMQGTFLTNEPSPWACQKRCQTTYGCAHFSYWNLGGHCHLQDASAVWTSMFLGFTA